MRPQPRPISDLSTSCVTLNALVREIASWRSHTAGSSVCTGRAAAGTPPCATPALVGAFSRPLVDPLGRRVYPHRRALAQQLLRGGEADPAAASHAGDQR